MTLKEAKAIYVAAGGPADHFPDEWEDVRREMEALVAAKTDRAACRLIQWWGCWDRGYTATAFARRVREAYAKIKASKKEQT